MTSFDHILIKTHAKSMTLIFQAKLTLFIGLIIIIIYCYYNYLSSSSFQIWLESPSKCIIWNFIMTIGFLFWMTIYSNISSFILSLKWCIQYNKMRKISKMAHPYSSIRTASYDCHTWGCYSIVYLCQYSTPHGLQSKWYHW